MCEAAATCTLIQMLTLLSLLLATDIYRAEKPDGTVIFTDSPPSAEYTLISSDHPVPTRGEISLRRFPRLDLWDGLISTASARYDVDAALIKAVVLAESGMNPRALSDKGAMGLMQLMPRTAEALGVADAWDPEQNIDGGTRYIREQLDTFGDVREAIAAYHAGPGAVRRYHGIPPYSSTQTYVARVHDLYYYFLNERPLALAEVDP